MNAHLPEGRIRVLFVDDEDLALKYFIRAFKKDYEVLTAASVDEGWNIIEEKQGDIAILLSDQRMPGKTGVDLLSRSRQIYPKIIRILTTAYSDLTSAIDGVNEGAIYQYIRKPWKIDELRATLKRAADFYRVQRERDILLREKMSVLQRLIIMDRVQSLAVFTVGLSDRINNPIGALSNFVTQLPPNFQEEWLRNATAKGYAALQGIGDLAQNESRSVLRIADKIRDATAGLCEEVSSECQLSELLHRVSQSPTTQCNDKTDQISVHIDSDLPPLKIHRRLMERCFNTLVDSMKFMCREGARMEITAAKSEENGKTQGIIIRFKTDPQSWQEHKYNKLFAILADDKEEEISLRLLSAFLLVHHHGGILNIHNNSKIGPGFEIDLPIDQIPVSAFKSKDECLDVLLRHYESWDAAML